MFKGEWLVFLDATDPESQRDLRGMAASFAGKGQE
jgi:hypothetical protein